MTSDFNEIALFIRDLKSKFDAEAEKEKDYMESVGEWFSGIYAAIDPIIEKIDEMEKCHD